MRYKIMIKTRSNQKLGRVFEIHVKGEINSRAVSIILGVERPDSYFANWEC